MRIKSLFLVTSSVLATMSAIAADHAETLDMDAAKQTATTVCAACHGADGNSVISVNPKLAGQSAAYLYKQLSEFKSGKRANAVMSLQVKDLTDGQMKALAAYYAEQTANLAKAKTEGKGSLGEKIYRAGIVETKVPACAACHGATGEGIPNRFPRVSAQHKDYTLQQLKNFRSGARENGPMMQTIAKKMTDAEMAAVADYIQGLR